MARYPQLDERSFVISSFGKTYHATGRKIGYCLAPVDLSREIQKIHQSVFYHRRNDYKVLRFCFAKKDETLQQAAERLCEI
jgi:methionine aminotransferase